MTLKRLLILPLLASLAAFAYFSSTIAGSFHRLLATVSISPTLIATVELAVILQIIGQIVRARKTALLFEPVKPSSVRFQFRALSVGYLFNAILPLRLGELIRARIISGGMAISFSYALVLIVFERLVDALLLGAAGLFIISVFVTSGRQVLLAYALTLLVLGALLLTGVILLMRQNAPLLRVFHRATEWLNDELRSSLRFKLWSVIYGLQQTIKRPLLSRYLAFTALAWACYFSSALLIVRYLFGDLPVGSKAVLALAPYYSMAVPSGPADLGVFSKVVAQFANFLRVPGGELLTFSLMVWALLVLPMAAIGVVLLFGKTRETLWQSRPRKASRQSLENKLYRNEDISQEMKFFLDNYFKGNSLSQIVHHLELTKGFRLAKYFKGGSDAITILALQDGKEVVKKIIPLEYEDRLKAQHDWLKRHSGAPGIVNVLAEERSGHYYAIDLEYDEEYDMFYDYIHQNPVEHSQKVMGRVWEILSASLYAKASDVAYCPEERQEYVGKHIFGCLEKAAAVEPKLAQAAASETIVVNGREYDNLHQVMARIKQHPAAWRDIATLRRSEFVHGDPAVDNILVSRTTGDVRLIDPAPDGNVLTGPVFDFGKNLQSLHCGYETLLRDEDPVFLTGGNQINFRDLYSQKYRLLEEYLRTELAPRYLTEPEQRAMLFHAAALFIRRLKHQVFYCPANVLKFYAVGVRTLNEFLAQYEPAGPRIKSGKQPQKIRRLRESLSSDPIV
jgi:hypothetical protein